MTSQRIVANDLKALSLSVWQLAEQRGLVPPGAQLLLHKASPANGIQWRLTGREAASGGLVTLSFLPEQGFLGYSARDAYGKLQMTAAALKAFPQTVRAVEQ